MTYPMTMFHYVYVMQNEDKELRTGYTVELSRQMAEQYQESLKPSFWRVIYCEVYLHVSDAIRRAQYLKSISGTKLLKQRLRKYLWR